MNYKWGMTINGNLVALPSTELVIWRFLSYPDAELFHNLRKTLVG